MSKYRQFLIAGLGNIAYPLTRHSVGHLVVDSLVERLKLQLRMAVGPKCLWTEISMPFALSKDMEEEDLRLVLMKSLPPMKLSGHAVWAALSYVDGHSRLYIPPEVNPEDPPSYLPSRHPQLILLHDSTEHSPQSVSVQAGGSANGHHGVRSVIDSLKKASFWRIGLGVGRDSGDGVSDWVMGRLSEEELRHWGVGGKGAEEVWEKIKEIITDQGTTALKGDLDKIPKPATPRGGNVGLQDPRTGKQGRPHQRGVTEAIHATEGSEQAHKKPPPQKDNKGNLGKGTGIKGTKLVMQQDGDNAVSGQQPREKEAEPSPLKADEKTKASPQAMKKGKLRKGKEFKGKTLVVQKDGDNAFSEQQPTEKEAELSPLKTGEKTTPSPQKKKKGKLGKGKGFQGNTVVAREGEDETGLQQPPGERQGEASPRQDDYSETPERFAKGKTKANLTPKGDLTPEQRSNKRETPAHLALQEVATQ